MLLFQARPFVQKLGALSAVCFGLYTVTNLKRNDKDLNPPPCLPSADYRLKDLSQAYNIFQQNQYRKALYTLHSSLNKNLTLKPKQEPYTQAYFNEKMYQEADTQLFTELQQYGEDCTMVDAWYPYNAKIDRDATRALLEQRFKERGIHLTVTVEERYDPSGEFIFRLKFT